MPASPQGYSRWSGLCRNIGSGETDAMNRIAAVIRGINEDYPDVRFHIFSGNAEAVMERLDKGMLDFGVLRARFPSRFCPLSFPPFAFQPQTKTFEIPGARVGAGTLPPRFSIFPAILAACFPAILAACRQILLGASAL